MSEYIVVKVDGSANGEDLAEALKEFKGVESVELDGDCSSDMLRDIGERLWRLEDARSLNCPLNEMRTEIESFLDESVSNGYKDMSMACRSGKPNIGLFIEPQTSETIARLKAATLQMKSVVEVEVFS
jgi:hypothetical protein